MPFDARQVEVQLNVAVAVDEIVDVGVGLHVLLGPQDKVLAVLTHIRRLLTVGALQPTVLRPFEAELHAPPRMNEVEQTLACAVVEHPAQELEVGMGVAQAVAVGKIEDLAVQLGCQRLAVHDEAALFLEVAVGPYIMVAGEEMHLDAHVGKLRQLTEETRVALGHDVLVFVPEVKHIAEQIDCLSLLLDAVEEAHEPALLHAPVGDSQRP